MVFEKITSAYLFQIAREKSWTFCPYRIGEASELSPLKLAWKNGTPCLLRWKICILSHLNVYQVQLSSLLSCLACSCHRFCFLLQRRMFQVGCLFFSDSFSSILLTIFFSLHHVFHTFSQKDVLAIRNLLSVSSETIIRSFQLKLLDDIVFTNKKDVLFTVFGFSSSIVVSLAKPNRC